MEDCIFCKIVKGEIPSYKIYEDEFAFAFLDIAGDVWGHTVVVPKSHCESLLTASAEQIAHVLDAVQKIAKHYVDDCGFDGVNVLNNTNECAGQTIMHMHFHIMPRKNGDNLAIYAQSHKTEMNFGAIAQKLKLN